MYEYTLKIQNDHGELYELTHDYGNYVIEDAEGFEPAPININSSKSTEDGSFFGSAHMQERNIVLHIVITGDTKEKITENRIKLYSIFSLKKPLTLFFTNTHKNVKIQCYAETVTPDIYSPVERAVVSLICPSPWFEEVPQEGDGQSGAVTSVEKNFEFPFSIPADKPVELSIMKTTPGRARVDNTGDIECGAVFKIRCTSSTALYTLTITNETTGDTFSLYTSDKGGSPLLRNNSYTLTVDTRPGKLSVFNTDKDSGKVTNLIGTRVSGSKWLRAVPGANYFTVTTANKMVALDMEVEITRLYAGV